MTSPSIPISAAKLVVGRGAGRELDDRLPVQDEAVLVERRRICRHTPASTDSGKALVGDRPATSRRLGSEGASLECVGGHRADLLQFQAQGVALETGGPNRAVDRFDGPRVEDAEDADAGVCQRVPMAYVETVPGSVRPGERVRDRHPRRCATRLRRVSDARMPEPGRLPGLCAPRAGGRRSYGEAAAVGSGGTGSIRAALQSSSRRKPAQRAAPSRSIRAGARDG